MSPIVGCSQGDGVTVSLAVSFQLNLNGIGAGVTLVVGIIPCLGNGNRGHTCSTGIGNSDCLAAIQFRMLDGTGCDIITAV